MGGAVTTKYILMDFEVVSSLTRNHGDCNKLEAAHDALCRAALHVLMTPYLLWSY